ncbi:MAG: PAS domain-containing protein [Pseudomonadota bacterium]
MAANGSTQQIPLDTEAAINEKTPRSLLVALGPDLKGFTADDSLGMDATEWMNVLHGFTKVGYWRVDIATGMVQWSPRTYEIHGLEYSPGPVAMTEAVKKYHPDDMPALMSLIEQAIENKCGFSFQLRLIDTNGNVKNVASVAAFKTDADGKEHLYGIFHEVVPAAKGVPTLHSLAY